MPHSISNSVLIEQYPIHQSYTLGSGPTKNGSGEGIKTSSLYSESYCSRVYKASGYSYFIFRTRKVSKTDAVVYRGPEYCMFCVSNE